MKAKNKSFIFKFSFIICAFSLICSSFNFRIANTYASATKPDTSNMINVIDENSNSEILWSALDKQGSDYKSETEYSYNKTDGAAITLKGTNGANVVSGASKINHSKADLGTVVHTLTTNLSENKDRYEWNWIVVRATSNYSDFLAFGLRKEFGHMALMSRYKDKWYSYSTEAIDPSSGTKVEAAYPNVSSSEEIKNTAVGGEVSLTIESSYNYIKVWVKDKLVFENVLLHKIPASTGVFLYTATNSNPKTAIKNVKCYVEDFTTFNNTITDDSIAYSPLGGGGAITNKTEKGSTLTPGSSKGGLAAISGANITGETIHTLSLNLDAAASNMLEWNSFIIRANNNYEDFLAIYVRRQYSHIALGGRVNGNNFGFSTSEPFEEENINVFPYISVLPNMGNFEQGTELNLTIISNADGVSIYNNSVSIYSVLYKDLKLKPDSNPYDFDFSLLPGMLASLPSVTAMQIPSNGYLGAKYYNINCYYKGEVVLDNTKDSFLSDIKYKGESINGFAPGSFEHDITISSKDTIDKTALTFTKFDNNAVVSEIIWSKGEISGFEKATISITNNNITRNYVITFEVYNNSQPSNGEDSEIKNEVKDESKLGCGSLILPNNNNKSSGLIILGSVFILLILLKTNKKYKGEKQ